jgi:hypothetical protein
MTKHQGYIHMVDFFTSFEWWKTDPHDELVTSGDFCLANPGETYAVYLPKGGSVTIKLSPGRYVAKGFNPITGEWLELPAVSGPTWTPPTVSSANDWALLLQRIPPR